MRTDEKVRNYIRKTELMTEGDRVIAAVSGGADSVFLFYVLKKLMKPLHLTLTVVHVHHGIRGEEADRDAAFVQALCEANAIACHVHRRNIPEEAKAKGLTLEEAGRIARYEILEQEAVEVGANKVAIAHHVNDAAENVLLQMSRGCGVAGIGSMRPMRELSDTHPEILLVRPLLAVTRQEIVDALTAEEISWCEDSTNREPDAARNRIRMDILPLLTEEVNSAAAEHLAEAARMAAETADFLKVEAKKRAWEYLNVQTDGVHIGAHLKAEMPAMQMEIIKMGLKKILPKGSMKDIGRVHLETVAELFDRQNGAWLNLPKGMIAKKLQDEVLLVLKPAEESVSDVSSTLPEEGISGRVDLEAAFGDLEDGNVHEVTVNGLVFTAQILPVPPERVPQNQYTKWFDYAKIKGAISIRTRRSGDFLTVGEGNMTKSISDYFTNEKVPREERDSQLLIADGAEIIWVVGMRIGYRYRVGNDTQKTLTLTVSGRKK